jgi:hypothetical protein
MLQAAMNTRKDSQLKTRFEVPLESVPVHHKFDMAVLAASIKQLEEGKGVEHDLIEA